MIRVTLIELNNARRREARVRVADESEAISRAVRKWFGARAEFRRENGIRTGIYGQITVPGGPRDPAENCVTGRVRIDIETSLPKRPSGPSGQHTGQRDGASTGAV